jgi:hypothetical protein
MNSFPVFHVFSRVVSSEFCVDRKDDGADERDEAEIGMGYDAVGQLQETGIANKVQVLIKQRL